MASLAPHAARDTIGGATRPFGAAGRAAGAGTGRASGRARGGGSRSSPSPIVSTGGVAAPTPSGRSTAPAIAAPPTAARRRNPRRSRVSSQRSHMGTRHLRRSSTRCRPAMVRRVVAPANAIGKGSASTTDFASPARGRYLRREPPGGTMTNWNFADIFEAVAAAVPDRPCQIQGERVVTWGEFDRRADALAADLVDAGLGHQTQGGGLPLQRPRVPRGVRRRVQGRRGAGQHELPLRPRRDRLPVRQRRRRGRRLPRHLRRAARRRSATGCRRCGAGTSSPTTPATGPDWAVPYEAVVGRRRRPRRGAVGSLAATTCCCSTPAARPACRRA